MPVKTTIQVRRDTAANWTSTNPTLAAGEIGFESDTNKIKIGNGSSTWTALNYASGAGLTASDTAPASPSVGTQWFNTSTGKSYVYYDSFWVELDSNGTSANGGQNAIINGAFDIWARGTTGAGYVNAAAPGFVADRWQGARGGAVAGQTMSRVSLGSTYQQQYAMRLQRDSGNTSTQEVRLSQSIETAESIRFAGRTVTLSFYARKGANYSAASNAFNAILYSGTGTDQNLLISGFTGVATVGSVTATLTDTFQRFTATGTVSGSATQLGLVLTYTPVGTAGAADYVEIVDVQLEAGSVATPFKRNAPSIQAELAACQRYYVRYDNTGDNGVHGVGLAPATNGAYIQIHLPTEMRVSPTAVDYSLLRLTDGVVSLNATAVSILISDKKTPLLNVSVASGATQYRPYLLQQQSTAGYVGFSAEL